MSLASGICACGGDVYVNGDGDLSCQGECGEVLLRSEIEAAEAAEELDASGGYDEDDFEDDGQPTEYEEWQDYMDPQAFLHQFPL